MLLSGFTFIRNAQKYDFPIKECIASMLPIVDELIVNVGDSEDGTEELVRSIASPKIKIIHSKWNDDQTQKGLVLSEQTNIALAACQGRWALYLQADEAIHENDYKTIRQAVEEEERSSDPAEGLRLRYLHFYGGYSFVQRPWNWYPNEIRIVRTSSGAKSFGDAQTFKHQDNDRELRTKLIDAYVYHYGHARKPEKMMEKIRYFHRFWHGDAHGIQVNNAYKLDLSNVTWFWGTHPDAYKERASLGLEWTQKPSQVVPAKFARIVIVTQKENWNLAVELKSVVEQNAPGTQVAITNSYRAWIKAYFVPTKSSRKQHALVDLEAATRPLPLFLIWIGDAVSGFKWRVAHSPKGKLGRFRKKFYSAVNWGAHEEPEKGFIVPVQEHAKQLARWLGLDL